MFVSIHDKTTAQQLVMLVAVLMPQIPYVFEYGL